MRTEFTAEQLRDPATAVAESIIRRCVHCGFCTATCPTYVLLGDELDSPRGRITLIQSVLERQSAPAPAVVRHVDRCLSCLACMTTCPSGVNYMHLVDHARAYIERHHRRPWRERAMRALLAAVLPHPRRLRAALRLARWARPLAPVLARCASLRPLAAMLRLAPRSPSRARAGESPLERRRAAAAASSTAPGEAARAAATARVTPGARVALLQGCAEQVLQPQVRAAAVRVLNRAGCEVIFARGEGCCGALVHHLGRDDEARAAARRNVDAWMREIEGAGLDAIVVTASGCGTSIKDYGFLLRDDPAYAARAARVAALAKDVSEVLAAIPAPPAMRSATAPEPASLPAPGASPRLAQPIKVAWHPPCSLQHGQRIADLAPRLLAAAGFVVCEPVEKHLCCGSAGTYNILQPEIAARLGDRKAANLERLQPDVIATANIGCAMQIAQRTGVPVVHAVELLDWASGGPEPVALSRHSHSRAPSAGDTRRCSR